MDRIMACKIQPNEYNVYIGIIINFNLVRLAIFFP